MRKFKSSTDAVWNIHLCTLITINLCCISTTGANVLRRPNLFPANTQPHSHIRGISPNQLLLTAISKSINAGDEPCNWSSFRLRAAVASNAHITMHMHSAFSPPSPLRLPRSHVFLQTVSKRANFTSSQAPLSRPRVSVRKRAIALPKLANRLMTRQDPHHIHKIAGISNLLSTTYMLVDSILFSVQCNQYVIPTDALYMPAFGVFAVSCLFLSASGLHLAYLYRSFLPARNVFMGSAGSLPLFAWLIWWCSPWFPCFLSAQWISVVVLTPLCLYGTLSTVATIAESDSIIEYKRDNRARERALQSKGLSGVWIRDFLVYILPTAYGLPFFGVFVPLVCILHSHVWFEQNIAPVGDLSGFILHFCLVASLSNSIGNFVVTLRDRKVIDRWLEMNIISLTSLAAFLSIGIAVSTHSQEYYDILKLFL